MQRFARPFLQKGIRVFSTWAANGILVAEYTLAQIFLVTKGYFSRIYIPGSSTPKGRVWKERCTGVFPGNYDMTVGSIGTGMIGRLVIERIKKVLEPVNCTPLYHTV